MKPSRPPARVWIGVLDRILPVLSRGEANDVALFGSQAMSVYTPRALASKDMDLIVPGMTLRVMRELCDELAKVAVGRPNYDYLSSEYSGREYPIFHVYFRHDSGYPMVVEIFLNFLGFESRRLAPFLTFRERWGVRVQVPTPEAIIGTRLSFRPPERITPFNARRLSRFITAMGRGVDWAKVNSFVDAFELRTVATENLRALASKRIFIPGTSHFLQGQPGDAPNSA